MNYIRTSAHPEVQKNAGTRRRMRLLMLVVFCFLAWAVITFWDQTAKLHAKADQLAELTNKLNEIKALNEKYKLEVERLNDSEYIEQKIRKDYHYTRVGETMFYHDKSSGY